MKKIIAKWLEIPDDTMCYYSLRELTSNHSFIGFIPRNSPEKFMIITNDISREILAIRPSAYNNIWCDSKKQETEDGDYFIFETMDDLLEWMKGK
jgi:hypothetical protein